MKSITSIITIFAFLFANMVFSQSNKTILLVPNTNENYCGFLDKNLQFRTTLNELTTFFQEKGYKVSNFHQLSKNLCGNLQNKANPDVLATIIKASHCDVYIMVDPILYNLPSLNYVELFITIYNAKNEDILLETSQKSEKYANNNVGFLSKKALELCFPKIESALEQINSNSVTVDDKIPPFIQIISPKVSRGFKLIEDNTILNVSGKVTDEFGIEKLLVNNLQLYLNPDGSFETSLKLLEGTNTVTVQATDKNQNSSTYQFFVTVNNSQVISNSENNKIAELSNNKRVALIIGNDKYLHAPPLRNAANDANSMSIVLQNLGFDVISITNSSQIEMKKAISDFGTKLSSDKNTVGLFFYSGHGLQVKGKNYIVPCEAKIEKEPEVDLYCVDLDGLLSQLEYAGNLTNIIILDACRNNPFARSFRSTTSNGLAPINATGGTLIAYSTAPGSTASDGDGSNGLYTQELIKAIQTPNLQIEDVFKKVRVNVKQLSNGLQIPWENSSLEGDFYFKK